VVSRLIGEIDDYLVETTLTTVLAFGSYLIAEQFHFSGVLAVVVAGLVCGDTTEHEMSPTTRIVVFNFWEYVAFLANSAVFLLIGLDIDVPALVDNWRAILWGIGAVLVARAIGVYGLSRLGRSMPWRWRHIMFWGGLRGAIALALALSLPFSWGEERRLLVVMTFGVVLFTLLVQGLTMEPLLRRLGLISRSDEQVEYERRQARVIAVRAGFDHLKRMHRDGLLSAHTWERLQPILQGRVDALAASVREALNQAPDLEVDEIITARREAFRAQRNMLANLRRDGVISEETYEQLVAEVDVALDSTTETMSLQMLESGILTDVQHLMFVIIQARDLEAASNALAVRNIHSTIIQAYGSFLGKTRYMLLVGVRQGKLLEAVDALHNSCRQRVEFPAQVGDLPLSLDPDVSFQVHGATVLALDVERFEVIP
jgi:CPA1 family monovalent cation:H+ antiporter